jgi:hypothetical protein
MALSSHRPNPVGGKFPAQTSHPLVSVFKGHGDRKGDPSTLGELLDDVFCFHVSTLPRPDRMSNFFLHYILLIMKDLRRGGGPERVSG